MGDERPRPASCRSSLTWIIESRRFRPAAGKEPEVQRAPGVEMEEGEYNSPDLLNGEAEKAWESLGPAGEIGAAEEKQGGGG